MAKAVSTELPQIGDFKLETLRGVAGFVRVGQTQAGQWWLLDGRDRPFFSRGIGSINRAGRADGRWVSPGTASAFSERLLGTEPSPAFISTVAQRLDAWHVNTLGVWTEPGFSERGFFWTELIEFRTLAPETGIRFGGAMLPDVFNPLWVAAATAAAAGIGLAHRDNRELIGYFTDHELGWAQPRAETAFMQTNVEAEAAPRLERPSLLQLCLSLEPSFPAYHAAWEFALAPYAGNLALLARSWGVTLANKETLRQLTWADTALLGRGYLRDNARFSREFARRYFGTCASAIRKADPNHLILGCRFGGPPGAAIVAECVQPHVDVLSVNDYRDTLDRRVDEYWRANAMPILIGSFSWVSDYFIQRAIPGERAGLTRVERMLSRGRAALKRAIAHPAVVGYAWQRWNDLPEDHAPFGHGLVHLDDRVASEHAELLTDLNFRAETLRRAAAR